MKSFLTNMQKEQLIEIKDNFFGGWITDAQNFAYVKILLLQYDME